MTVRRKSNWYVYLIAFGITLAFVVVAVFAFKWYLFPEDTQPVDNNKTGELTDDFRPTAEHNFNMLGMLSDSPTNVPDLFVMIMYNAVENRITLIPMPAGISLAKDGRTLPNIYAAQGGDGVASVLESIVGVHFNSYVKLDRSGFVDLVSFFGNAEYDVAKTIIIRDGDDIDTLNVGTQLLTAASIFRLIMKVDFEDGESYRFNCAGGVLSDLINQNFRSVDGSMLDRYYQMIIDSAETNLTETKYRAHRAALLNTVEYGVYPAEYYVPYGEYTEDGGFTISENSVITIKQKADLM